MYGVVCETNLFKGVGPAAHRFEVRESVGMFVYIIVRMLDDNFMALVLIATLFYLISSFGCQLCSLSLRSDLVTMNKSGF